MVITPLLLYKAHYLRRFSVRGFALLWLAVAKHLSLAKGLSPHLEQQWYAISPPLLMQIGILSLYLYPLSHPLHPV